MLTERGEVFRGVGVRFANFGVAIWLVLELGILSSDFRASPFIDLLHRGPTL